MGVEINGTNKWRKRGETPRTDLIWNSTSVGVAFIIIMVMIRIATNKMMEREREMGDEDQGGDDVR